MTTGSSEFVNSKMNNEENTALLTEQPSDQPSNYGAIESNEENQNSRQIVRFS